MWEWGWWVPRIKGPTGPRRPTPTRRGCPTGRWPVGPSRTSPRGSRPWGTSPVSRAGRQVTECVGWCVCVCDAFLLYTPVCLQVSRLVGEDGGCKEVDECVGVGVGVYVGIRFLAPPFPTRQCFWFVLRCGRNYGMHTIHKLNHPRFRAILSG